MPYSLRTRQRQPLAPIDISDARPTLKRLPSSASLRSPQKHSRLEPPTSPGPSSSRSRSVHRSGGVEGKRGSVTPRMSLSKMMGMEEKGVDGKSPARRLFGPETPTSGISGAILTPSRLAPSPPIDESTSSPFVVLPTSSSNLPNTGAENGQDGQHDPGFVVLPDPKGKGKARTSPVRLRRGRSRSRSAAPEEGVEPSSIEMENQENIPPPPPVPPLPSCLSDFKSKLPPSPISHPSLSRSTTTTSPSSSPSSSLLPPPMSHSASSWSGTPGRRRERSKLVNELLILRGEAEMPTFCEEKRLLEEEGEELTPGKRVLRSTRGREKLAKEVDQL
ncbi:hypothetical protein IAR50_006586 [Cryptococcus sp. DSM 104548]